MSSKKLAATGLLTFVMVTQLAVVAFAEDDSNDSSFVAPTSGPVMPTARPVAPIEKKHHEVEHEEHYQISVPPVVITPDSDDSTAGVTNKPTSASVGKPSFRVSPPNGTSVVAPDNAGKQNLIEPKTSSFDPEANAPIDVNNIHLTSKTPADVFLESAQIGIGAMAAGAALLGVAAAVRGVRFRRQANTDFIYEVEN